jgi:hypothetical protein
MFLAGLKFLWLDCYYLNEAYRPLERAPASQDAGGLIGRLK